MCQHYEHSAAESTIDLDSSHHGCRELSENPLSPRCDRRERAPALVREEQPPPQAGQERSPRPRHPGRLKRAAMSATRLRRLRDPAARTVDSPRNINLLSPGCQCPRPDSNRQPAD